MVEIGDLLVFQYFVIWILCTFLKVETVDTALINRQAPTEENVIYI